ncbi:uncharacterized protein LOC141594756 [Silene latifolia]|uniref:uncharacterized protein LOC141594756 n=1 Tax=Silene latifolia TaxID=37657 RepID=UPI003D771D38
METIHEIDNIKIEKAKAMRRYKTFRKIANIFRSLELFVAILLTFICISWSSSYIPAIVQFTGEFLRRLSTFLFSPHFVFVIGNIIIITLFANSSFAEKSDQSEHTVAESLNSGEFPPENAELIVDAMVSPPAVVEKVYRRSQSAAAVEITPAVDRREFRRSATVPRRKIKGGEIATAVAAEARRRRKFEEDELSNDEFNRKVEEFIEKQRKFLSEETMTLVLSS